MFPPHAYFLIGGLLGTHHYRSRPKTLPPTDFSATGTLLVAGVRGLEGEDVERGVKNRRFFPQPPWTGSRRPEKCPLLLGILLFGNCVRACAQHELRSAMDLPLGLNYRVQG
jgi:hypothetical protein